MSRGGAAGSNNNVHHDLKCIEEKHQSLVSELNLQTRQKQLIERINQWKAESVKHIENHAETTIQTVKTTFKNLNDSFSNDMRLLSEDIQKIKKANIYDDAKINGCKKLLDKWADECQRLAMMRISQDASPSIPMIKIDMPQRAEVSRDPSDSNQGRNKHQNDSQDLIDLGGSRWTQHPTSHHQQIAPKLSQSNSSRSMSFPNTGNVDPGMKALFEKLTLLSPMEKYGPMSGTCDEQTTQMENFLRREFGFENIPGQEIVHGVRTFRLRQPPDHREPKTVIFFPKQQDSAFSMTIEEIRKWQQSYRVYAPRLNTQITPQFLQKALQGGSESGPEAFLMKFVVRISTCPILMEFDARVKDRKLADEWPHKIKLVSVTGVDFACRIHDVDDVKNYIRNWQEVFVLNSRAKLPEVRGGRDLIIRDRPPKADLDVERLCQDLMTMAKTRLQACEYERVQIVVETGIGLGVFSGSILGIDDTVRKISAIAVRKVLEQEGPRFQNIKAVIFALPIFSTRNDPDGYETSVFRAFTQEFANKNYRGPIPVLVIDQDMHRLAVSIAKLGYCVSELNPADSHGVFGEYWQNRGPAVEEKLALTTLGLLVQHHLINRNVLDPKNYYKI